jgi:hypothetical protein
MQALLDICTVAILTRGCDKFTRLFGHLFYRYIVAFSDREKDFISHSIFRAAPF